MLIETIPPLSILLSLQLYYFRLHKMVSIRPNLTEAFLKICSRKKRIWQIPYHKKRDIDRRTFKQVGPKLLPIYWQQRVRNRFLLFDSVCFSGFIVVELRVFPSDSSATESTGNKYISLLSLLWEISVFFFLNKLLKSIMTNTI